MTVFNIIMAIALSLGLLFSPTPIHDTSVPDIDVKDFTSCKGMDWVDNDPTNGFINQFGHCIPGYVSTESWFMKQPELIKGNAVFYNPGIMHTTAKYRGMFYPDGYLGGVALGSPGEIGETVWLFGPNGWEGPYLVVDCPQRVDVYTTVVINQQSVEVDFNTAMRWGMVEWNNPLDKGEGYFVRHWFLPDVMVYKGELLPADINEREPVYFAEWWLERVELSDKVQPKPLMTPDGNHPLWKLYGTREEEWLCFSCN